MAEKKQSMKWCIEHNDFEYARTRLESTSASWKERWFETCKIIFESCKELATRYVLDPIQCAIHKVTVVKHNKRKSKYSDSIQISAECNSLHDEATQKCYLFEFFNEAGDMLCSKVGTTTRSVIQRLKRELASKTYKEMGAVRAVIRRVYDCGSIPAEGLESFFRAEYIRKYPDSFKKNDRFLAVKLDLAEADKIYEKYFAVNA